MATLKNAVLTTEEGIQIPLGSKEWDEWVRNHNSFRFEGAGSNITVRKQGNAFYGYKKVSGNLINGYISTLDGVTMRRLEDSVREILEKGEAKAQEQPKDRSKDKEIEDLKSELSHVKAQMNTMQIQLAEVLKQLGKYQQLSSCKV